jgi:magnesium transporter
MSSRAATADIHLSEVQSNIQRFFETRNASSLREFLTKYSPVDIAESFDLLGDDDKLVVFRLMPREMAAEVFEYLPLNIQEGLIKTMARRDLARVLNEMAADDRTDLFEELPATVVQQMLALLKPEERAIAVSLLGYPEGSIGRLMTPEYVRVRQEWTVAQALDHIRRYGKDSETLNMIYVVDERGVLIDDLRIRSLLLADPNEKAADLMEHSFVALKATDNEEEAVAAFRRTDLHALPVTDSRGVLIGIVTVDDVLDVAERAATEDIQKIGGTAALEEPYMNVGFFDLLRKRAGWLIVLFIGQMLTATAMGLFHSEIEKALVLTYFVALIISSGGNSGSQAATLVIRALALGEVTLTDWWRVMRRELLSGLALGLVLGVLGFLRIVVFSNFTDFYGNYPILVALTIGLTVIGVVTWGTLIGSMLPFVLRRFGLDPAASSAPFVATLIDVTGIVIYFTMAALLLRGTLL